MNDLSPDQPNQFDTQTDEELAGRLQKGDTEALGVLIERYEQKLLRYGRKFLSAHEDIEDSVQNVFISAYQNIRSFNTAQRFSPWIYRIAHNAFVNELRKRSRTKVSFVDLDTFLAHPVTEDTAAKEYEQEEIRLMANEGMEKISSQYREIIILYYLEEMSYKDIADVLQIPTGTVGIRLKRAKESLKKVYKEMNVKYEQS